MASGTKKEKETKTTVGKKFFENMIQSEKLINSICFERKRQFLDT